MVLRFLILWFLICIFRIGTPERPKTRCDNVLEICCRFRNGTSNAKITDPASAQQVATTLATTLNTTSGAVTTPSGTVTTAAGAVTTVATPAGAVTTVAGAVTTVAAVTTSAGAATTAAGVVTTAAGATTLAGAVTTPAGAATTAATTPAGAVTTPAGAATTAGAVTTPPAAATTPPVATTLPGAATTAPGAVTTTAAVTTAAAVTTPPATTTTLTTTTTRPATPPPTQGQTTAAPATPPPTTMSTPAVTTTRPTVPTVTPAGQCGISYADTNREMVEGNPFIAAFMEFPWMLALMDYRAMVPDGRQMNNAFICGASLLSKDIAMTAAHCIKGREPSSLFVRAGDWNTLYANETLPSQDRSLSRIIIHPEYNNLTLYNDIAILKLDQPVLFANNVQPVCLPKTEDRFFGQQCIATGWGQNAFGPGGRYQTKMRKVTLPILNQNDCQAKLRLTRLGSFFNLHESFICAGGTENYDTCTGDGGGPLVCKVGNTYTQAGIVSWGIGCGGKDIPGVYVNVPLMKPWIDSTMYNLIRDNLPK